MAVIGTILVLLALGVFLWGVVGLIRPEWAQLPNRASSLGAWVLAVVLFVIGGVLMPASGSGALTGELIMAAIGTILVLLALGVFLWGVVGLIRPEWAQLPDRASSLGAWVLAVVLFVIGGVLMPDDETSSAVSTPTDGQEAVTITGAVTAAAERPATSPTEAPCIPTELSPAAVELVRLYEELHTFKDDIEFIDMGFSQAGPVLCLDASSQNTARREPRI